MHYQLRYLYGFLLLLLTTTVAVSEWCYASKITDCDQQYAKISVFAGNNPHGLDSPQTISVKCSRLADWEQCISSFKDDCNELQKIRFKSRTDLETFICLSEENYSEVYRCLNKTNGKKEVLQNCYDSTAPNMQQVERDIGSSADRSYTEYCRKLNSYVDCIKKELNTKCGEKVAKYAYGSLHAKYKTYFVAMKCESDPSDPSGDTMSNGAIVGICIGLVVFIVLVIVIAFVVIKKRQKSEPQEVDHRSEPPQDVGYDNNGFTDGPNNDSSLTSLDEPDVQDNSNSQTVLDRSSGLNNERTSNVIPDVLGPLQDGTGPIYLIVPGGPPPDYSEVITSDSDGPHETHLKKPL